MVFIPFRSINFRWEHSELEEMVTSGTFKKITDITEHVALHPFWLSDPMQGIKEDFDKALGRWRPRLSGYLVAYEEVRRDGSKAAMMNVDQPWLHLDVRATFYIYMPAVGQIVKGVVKRVGATAAICLVFNCFPMTVDPNSLEELYTWYNGTEIEVEITSFENRRKGPQMRAKCVRVLPSTTSTFWSNGNESGTYDPEGNDFSAMDHSNISKDITLNISVPRSMKTKKNTITKFDDSSDEDPEPTSLPKPMEQVDSRWDTVHMPEINNNSKDFKLNISVPRSKKTKGNTITKFLDDDEEPAPPPPPAAYTNVNETPTKAKKRKSTKIEVDVNDTPTKSKKRRSTQIEADVSDTPTKSKKRKHAQIEEPTTPKETKSRKKKRSLEPEEISPITPTKIRRIKKELNFS